MTWRARCATASRGCCRDRRPGAIRRSRTRTTPSSAASIPGNRASMAAGALRSAFIEVALAKFGGDWDWDGAELAFRRGLALDPADPLAHVHYSWLLMLLGREDAAFAEAQRGHALAPSSRFVAA